MKTSVQVHTEIIQHIKIFVQVHTEIIQYIKTSVQVNFVQYIYKYKNI